MKKIYTISLPALMVVIMLGLTACGGSKRGQYGTLMNNKEHIEKAVALGNETFEESDDILQIVFKQKDGMGVTKYAGSMDVYFYEGDVDSVKLARVYLVKNDPMISDYVGVYKKNYSNLKRENSVKFSQIDFSKIPDYLTEAGAMVVEAGADYEEPLFYSGVGDYTMLFDKDPANAVHKFSIQSKDTAASTRNMDRYYEFKFEVKDGKLVAKDL